MAGRIARLNFAGQAKATSVRVVADVAPPGVRKIDIPWHPTEISVVVGVG
jgi:hypothetical protein